MKTQPRLTSLAIALFAAITLTSAQADDTLWNLTFKAGESPAGAPFTPPSSSPQKVATDAKNTLVGAATVGPLQNALQFTKGSNTNYTPALTLKGTSALTSGVVTVNMDLVIDQMTPNETIPVEALMAVPFMNGDGGSEYILVIARSGSDFVLGGAGLDKGKTTLHFEKDKVVHLKAVLDLNKHTFQAFLNDQPMADAQHDDAKFSSFLGMTVRDGTALGGNKGTTFTAGVANLVVTKS